MDVTVRFVVSTKGGLSSLRSMIGENDICKIGAHTALDKLVA